MKAGIIGAGSWGTAIGIQLAGKNIETVLWDRDNELLEEINTKRTNSKYLPKVMLPENLRAVSTQKECADDADVVIIAVPSHAVRKVCEDLKSIIKESCIFVSLTKGIENVTFKRMSQIIGEIFPNNKVVVLSGPSHAEEVSIGIPTTIVSASESKEAAEYIQDLFISPNLRVYTNPDVVGVELGAAIKNIIALAAGISDGLGYGDNTKAALMTRGMVEIARLGLKMGANPLTFAGLTGVGDLIVTCTSMHSRNRRAGILIGKGMSPEEAAKEVKMVVEGIYTTKSAYELSKSIGIEMPITNELYEVLFQGKSPRTAVNDLMLREKKHEVEEVAEYKTV